MKLSVLSFLFFLLFISVNTPSDGDEVLGIWLTDDGRAKVKVYKEGGLYHGKIVWLEEPEDENGQVHLDLENPSEKLRDRPILGIDLIGEFVYDGDGEWTGGELYNPDNGKTYLCKMTLKGDKLKVRGYLGIPMFGRTVIWTRVE